MDPMKVPLFLILALVPTFLMAKEPSSEAKAFVETLRSHIDGFLPICEVSATSDFEKKDLTQRSSTGGKATHLKVEELKVEIKITKCYNVIINIKLQTQDGPSGCHGDSFIQNYKDDNLHTQDCKLADYLSDDIQDKLQQALTTAIANMD